ncbi:MAG: tape measure protein, partial [Casimicrobium sp.]
LQAEDEARVLLARIKGVTGSLEEARATYRGIVSDAVSLRIPLGEALQGYTKIAGAVKELGGTSKQARELNEILLATAKISGASGVEAAAAARQFAQALGSGVLQGDELRSILENNQELARQLARGLGVSVGELRRLGEQGRLTADVVANALLGRLPEIRNKLTDVPLTAADAWLKLTTVVGNWITQGDQVSQKAGLIASSLNSVADAIVRVTKEGEARFPVVGANTVNTEPGLARDALNGLAIGVSTEPIGDSGAQRQRLISSFRQLEISQANEVQGALLGVSQAVKAAATELDKEISSFLTPTERFGKNLGETVLALNKYESALRNAITAKTEVGESVADEEQKLARVIELRERVSKDGAAGALKAQGEEYKQFEATVRISVDSVIESIARRDKLSSLAASNETTRIALQRGALEESLALGLLGIRSYADERQKLAGKQAAEDSAALANEQKNNAERISLLKAAVASISEEKGKEAAIRSESY